MGRLQPVNCECCRIDFDDYLPLALGVHNCLTCTAGLAVPYCNDVISMINHITVALVHAVGRVMGLNQCFLIALGSNVEVPIS